jgi:lysophosphatidylcholine acyltransferase/lyso-PAF acetyltransferase
VWRHIWLLLCQPYHNVICYELPVYEPSPEERTDPALYANNMREYMVRGGADGVEE